MKLTINKLKSQITRYSHRNHRFLLVDSSATSGRPNHRSRAAVAEDGPPWPASAAPATTQRTCEAKSTSSAVFLGRRPCNQRRRDLGQREEYRRYVTDGGESVSERRDKIQELGI